MARNKLKSLQSIHIDGLHKYLKSKFSKFTDKRDKNKSISLSDALMSGYAMFSLKDPSLLFFNNKRPSRQSNLSAVYYVENPPSDTGMRRILDEVDWKEFSGIHQELFGKIKQAGILSSYSYYQDYKICSIDGVHFYSSGCVSCDKCMKYTKRNGEEEYRHYLLSGVLVNPDLKAVIPLEHEPIIKQDGTDKNDCERNAAKRLLPKLQKVLGNEKTVIVEDALGANGPHIRDIKAAGFHYIIGAKPTSNQYLFEEFNLLKSKGKVHIYDLEIEGVLHHFEYVNNLVLNAANPDIKVNFLDYRQIDLKGKQPTQHFTWITDLPLNKKSVFPIMRMGRSRWKIENETFNTLKNQQYHFDHNFGHGDKHLSTVFPLLMMLAFLVDQLQQGWNELFKQAWEQEQSKVALWEAVRQKFNEYDVGSMQLIYKLIIGLAKVKYEIIEDSS